MVQMVPGFITLVPAFVISGLFMDLLSFAEACEDARARLKASGGKHDPLLDLAAVI